MAIRKIVTVPHPVLRQQAKKVSEFNAELQTLIDDMIETMRAAPGVGLAAPQVNVPLRLFVAEFGDEDDPEAPTQVYVVINPRITWSSRQTETGVEGCLSIPELVGEVVRPRAVTVKGLDRHGQPLTLKAEGWLARIFQHEIDHLMGVLFTDHALQVWKPEKAAEPDLAAA